MHRTNVPLLLFRPLLPCSLLSASSAQLWHPVSTGGFVELLLEHISVE